MPFANPLCYLATPSGLSLKDYLDGKEGKHKELLEKTIRMKTGIDVRAGASNLLSGVPQARVRDAEDSSVVVSEDLGLDMPKNLNKRNQVGGKLQMQEVERAGIGWMVW